MSYYYQRQRISQVVKTLIFINVFVFILQSLTQVTPVIDISLERWFAFDYLRVMYEYRIWQIFTYMFLHANWWHLLFNMLALYFIGSDVEREWGSKSFLQYYLACGFGAGIFIFLSDFISVLIDPNNISFLGITLGASGAIFGLILAFSILFRDREITLLLFFVIPVTIRGRNLLLISLFLTIFFPLLMGGGVKISHSGHIGGALSGFLFLLMFRKNPYFAHAYYSLSQWWNSIRNSFKGSSFRHNSVRRDFFNSNTTFRYPKNYSSENNLDETKMSDREIEEKIDQLLDVISENGINDLSESEKKFLERVSILYQHKFPN